MNSIRRNCYDPPADEVIFHMLDKYKSLNFNQLVRLLQENKVIKNRTVISKHLKYLTDKNILQWEKQWEKNSIGKPTIGKPSSITFTKVSWFQRKYGIFKVDYDKKRGICKEWRELHKVDIKNDRRAKLLIFLLLHVSMGHRNLRYTSEIRPGLLIRRDSSNRSRPYFLNYKEGFSPDDLDIEYDENCLSYPDLLMLNRFTSDETTKMVNDLEKKGDIDFIKSSKNGQIRYHLKDEDLKNLFIECFVILQQIITIMQQYWYIFNKTLGKGEFEWYRKVVGEQISTGFFLKIEGNRASKKTIEQLCHEYKSSHPYSPLADKILENIDDYQKKLSNKTKRQLLTDLYANDISLRHALHRLSTSEDIKKILSEKKYEWILEGLRPIIHPSFLNGYYNIDF